MFIHEHPKGATSWGMRQIQKLAEEEEVDVVEADQCMYGLKTRGKGKSEWIPAKKPTRFLTNSRPIARELQRKCDHTHPHQQLVDGRASEAARYPEGLCKAICRGIAEEKRQRAMNMRVVMEVAQGAYPRLAAAREMHEEEPCPLRMHGPCP